MDKQKEIALPLPRQPTHTLEYIDVEEVADELLGLWPEVSAAAGYESDPSAQE